MMIFSVISSLPLLQSEIVISLLPPISNYIIRGCSEMQIIPKDETRCIANGCAGQHFVR